MKQRHAIFILIILTGFIPCSIFGGEKNCKTSVKSGMTRMNITPIKPALMSGYDSRKNLPLKDLKPAHEKSFIASKIICPDTPGGVFINF